MVGCSKIVNCLKPMSIVLTSWGREMTAVIYFLNKQVFKEQPLVVTCKMD